MKKADKAIEYFRNNFNCSQSVFAVFGTDFGLSENEMSEDSLCIWWWYGSSTIYLRRYYGSNDGSWS